MLIMILYLQIRSSKGGQLSPVGQGLDLRVRTGS